jgi:hypothetical protein
MWLHLSKTDKVWGWFMIRTVLSGQELRAGIGGVLKRALHAGVNDGAFKHDDVEMAHEIIFGLLLLASLQLVSAKVDEDYPDKIVGTALRTLGLTEPTVHRIMSKPLPELDLPPFLGAAAQ